MGRFDSHPLGGKLPAKRFAIYQNRIEWCKDIQKPIHHESSRDKTKRKQTDTKEARLRDSYQCESFASATEAHERAFV